jgi:hypothetical protein
MLPFVNVKLLVVRHLKSILAPTSVRTKLPIPLNLAELPLVQVYRAPGGESEHTAIPRIDLHNFAADEDAMWALTARSHAAMAQLARRSVEGQLIDWVNVVQDPADQPWSATVARSVAVYELGLRPA